MAAMWCLKPNDMDNLSRFGDNDAWELVDWAWAKVETWYGPHSFDRFANMLTYITTSADHTARSLLTLVAMASMV